MRTTTKTSIGALVTSLAISGNKAKLVTILYIELANYLEDVYDKWDIMEAYLYFAHYNFEMADFYQDILFRNYIYQCEEKYIWPDDEEEE